MNPARTASKANKASKASSTPEFDVAALRAQFPVLARALNGKPLAYLDNAATTQKPRCVLDAILAFYEECNANVHRAAHGLATEATERFEGARAKTAAWINAATPEQLVWTRGTTEAINLVAAGLDARLAPGDEILVSMLEHHSNFVPWQQLALRTGAQLRLVPLTASGELDASDIETLLNPRTRVLALTHVSNALGTEVDVAPWVERARELGCVTLLDGAQAMAHLRVDVQALGCDFYAFSGHKMYGPTGIGALYGRREALLALPPWQFGGEMIRDVRVEASTWNDLPYRFEAGTPHLDGAIGLGAAIGFLATLDHGAVLAHEQRLRLRTEAGLRQMPGVRIVGEAARKSAVVSFVVEGAHPHDVGTLLDAQGVAVRTGHHCTMPLMRSLGLPGGTVRASFALYNDDADVDRLLTAVDKALTMLR